MVLTECFINGFFSALLQPLINMFLFVSDDVTSNDSYSNITAFSCYP